MNTRLQFEAQGDEIVLVRYTPDEPRLELWRLEYLEGLALASSAQSAVESAGRSYWPNRGREYLETQIRHARATIEACEKKLRGE